MCQECNLWLLTRIYQHITSENAIILDDEEDGDVKREHDILSVSNMQQPSTMEKDSNINIVDYPPSLIRGPTKPDVF